MFATKSTLYGVLLFMMAAVATRSSIDESRLNIVQERLEKSLKAENKIPIDVVRAATLLYSNLGIWSCKDFTRVSTVGQCYKSKPCNVDRKFYHKSLDMRIKGRIEICKQTWSIMIYMEASRESFIRLRMEPIKVKIQGNPKSGFTEVFAESTFTVHTTTKLSAVVDNKYQGWFTLHGLVRYDCRKPFAGLDTRLSLNFQAPHRKYSSIFTISKMSYHMKHWNKHTEKWEEDKCIACLSCTKVCKWDILLREIVGRKEHDCDSFTRSFVQATEINHPHPRPPPSHHTKSNDIDNEPRFFRRDQIFANENNDEY